MQYEIFNENRMIKLTGDGGMTRYVPADSNNRHFQMLVEEYGDIFLDELNAT